MGEYMKTMIELMQYVLTVSSYDHTALMVCHLTDRIPLRLPQPFIQKPGTITEFPVAGCCARCIHAMLTAKLQQVLHRENSIFCNGSQTCADKIPAHTGSIRVHITAHFVLVLLIAGAGKAAHLPGMCAAIFPLPVIGIPMKTSDLGGVDSLYSIVQMPSGIPVATVAINGGANAGILAAKILAASDEELLGKLKAYSEDLKEDVEKKAEKLEKIGYKEYLAQK